MKFHVIKIHFLILFTLSYQFNIYAQASTREIQKEIITLSTEIKNLKEKTPNNNTALGLLAQIKIANIENSSESILNIERKLGQQYLGKYHDQILKLTRSSTLAINEINHKKRKIQTERINALIFEIETACSKNLPSNGFSQLLLEADTLKTAQKKFRNSSTVSSRIDTVKIDSAMQFLEKWMIYKRFEEKGYAKQASESLKALTKSSNPYPILNKAFLDKKYAEIERTRVKIESPAPTKKEAPLLSKQVKIIQLLESGELNPKTTFTAAEQLSALSITELEGEHNITLDHTSESIRDLADCLYYIENKDLRRARFRLEAFFWGSADIRIMKDIRKKTAFKTIPILYSEINIPVARPDQSLSDYLLRLISAPKSLQEVEHRKDLMSLFNTAYPSDKKPSWLFKATMQYDNLTVATIALRCQEYTLAHSYFKNALSSAPNAGPANASKFIESQLKQLYKLQPALLDPALSSNSRRIEYLHRRIKETQKRLKLITREK